MAQYVVKRDLPGITPGCADERRSAGENLLLADDE